MMKPSKLTSSLSFHLVQGQDGTKGEGLILSNGPCHLSPDTLEVTAGLPGDPTAVLVFEPRPPQLLMLNPGRLPVRVNDSIAPRVLVLEEGDHLFVGEHPPLAVALYSRPQLGPPEESALGKACAVCRTPFEADSQTYQCASCGCTLHLEDGDDPDELLRCAEAVTNCPICSQPINLEEGYVTTGLFEQ